MKKQYSNYKPSGVEWIGEVPSHWDVKPLKYVAHANVNTLPETTAPDYELDYVEISDVDTLGNIINKTRYQFSESPSRCRRILKKGDVFISTVRTYLKSIGYVKDNVINLICSTGFCILSPKENMKSEFLFHMVLSEWFIGQVISKSEGVSYPSITSSELITIRILLPPLSEQEQIVKYLDEKTAEIDKLVAITERKIELLKEKRIALINETVTKGLNRNTDMRDSGIEWIGEVPSHWDVRRFKYCVKLITDKGIPSPDAIKISPENVENGTGICSNLYSEYQGEGIQFNSGDILLNKLRIYLKKVILAQFEGYSMGEMIVLRTIEGLNRFYFYLLLNQGFIELLNAQSEGVKLPRVAPETILNCLIVSPPLSEQEQIVKYLDEKTAEIDKLVGIEQRRILTLKEYRQCLINEVVTGKVRVSYEQAEPKHN